MSKTKTKKKDPNYTRTFHNSSILIDAIFKIKASKKSK